VLPFVYADRAGDFETKIGGHRQRRTKRAHILTDLSELLIEIFVNVKQKKLVEKRYIIYIPLTGERKKSATIKHLTRAELLRRKEKLNAKLYSLDPSFKNKEL